MIQELLIISIRTDCGIQSRKKISEEYISELVEAIKAGVKLPPVDVYNDGTDIWMADGFHRILAYAREGKANLTANVHKGTLKDAKIHSIGANKTHGLRRTNEDKRNCVQMALEIMPERSDKMIADHVGVTHPFVANLRRSLVTITSEPPKTPMKRIGSDGIARNIPPPRPPVMPPKMPPAPPVNITPPPARKITPKEERLDENLKPIPDHLWPLWDKGEVIKEMAADITRVLGIIRRMHDSGDKSILDGNGQDIIAALETAKGNLKANIPYAVCPYCKGTLSENCRFCKGRGIIGSFRFKQVPEELKR